ncbi:HAMP domain-containing sensor histidine kinase [Pleurocapsa sp. PCC 7319]|uniref:sensor histidine kinase n=1 Tax=Pleurocapsa sp. PCC 7319 TaxID=118161 RepID=UPI000345F864|nr:sensor histidine kinase [Pleurocapsa sp. PCC 7319]
MSQDLGKSLLAKTDVIIESWIAAIREDVDVESSKDLAYKSVRNSIPLVMEALATILSQSISDRHQKLEDNGWEHGIVRAEQGYDVAEIVREYSLLRTIIFDVLTPELIANSGTEIIEKVKTIDSTLDRVITLSLESYLATRLKELEQVRSQLILTNQELTRLVATQKEDVSHMAHELKSPLNAIMGFSSLLLQQQKQAVKGNETSLSLQMTEKVVSNGRQLLRLINDILEVSRYETGKIPLNIEPCNVRSLIQIVVETLTISANQKDLEIIFNCDIPPEKVQTDSLRLQQIVTNLVSNAIRYTESGTITVTCSVESGDRWSLTVADTGIGLNPEAQAQIFEPYYRVGSKKGYSEGSTGLGLTIVDKLVKLLQGTINLDSELGKGSTFKVIFPL